MNATTIPLICPKTSFPLAVPGDPWFTQAVNLYFT